MLTKKMCLCKLPSTWGMSPLKESERKICWWGGRVLESENVTEIHFFLHPEAICHNASPKKSK